MRYRAYGSSYLLRQCPGSERVGGLTAVLAPKEAEVGAVSVKFTGWKTDEAINGDYDWLVEAAVLGANEAAASLNLLNDFDIELCRFLVHDVDSSPALLRHVAKGAVHAAYEAWTAPYFSRG